MTNRYWSEYIIYLPDLSTQTIITRPLDCLLLIPTPAMATREMVRMHFIQTPQGITILPAVSVRSIQTLRVIVTPQMELPHFNQIQLAPTTRRSVLMRFNSIPQAIKIQRLGVRLLIQIVQGFTIVPKDIVQCIAIRREIIIQQMVTVHFFQTRRDLTTRLLVQTRFFQTQRDITTPPMVRELFKLIRRDPSTQPQV